MDWSNLIFGLIGVAGFVFSIWTYYKTESKKTIEASKISMQQERMRSTKYAVVNLFHAANVMVQMPKKGPMSVAQLQDMARSVRGQAYALSKQLEAEEQFLESWRFGQIIASEVPIHDPELSIPKKRDPGQRVDIENHP